MTIIVPPKPLTKKVCAIGGCAEKVYARGWCQKHYAHRWSVAHREENRERARRYRAAHPERVRKAKAAYHKRNPEANREYHVRTKYGLTLDEYDGILAKGCAICGSRAKVHLDHDHKNGKVRDALCINCNTALGLLSDDPARFLAAAEYLRLHSGQ